MSIIDKIKDKLKDWWINDSDEEYDSKVLEKVKRIEEVQAKVHASRNGDFIKRAAVNESKAAKAAKTAEEKGKIKPTTTKIRS